ncbi:MAG: phytanoyl-CoA dioxygenase family protein [Planctomycetota bacterium]
MTAATHEDLLNEPYTLSEEQIAQFAEQGFIKLKDVFSPEVLDHYGKAITDFVMAKNDLANIPMEERSTYQKAFIQISNLWRESDVAREFVFGKRLGRIAAQLLEVTGVRIYHDQALYKEPSGGFTPWHADQQYWPLATDRTVTAWVPLHAASLDMGPLAFAAGSQNLTEGRDLEISDDSERIIAEKMENGGFPINERPFDAGEVSFHLGWTYHRAGPNTTTDPRRIMTVIYMDEDMTLKEPENENQQRDWEMWCPGAKIDEVIDTPFNPVVYSSR